MALPSPAGGDPLLQPFQLRHLHLRNRVVTTAHEPAYTEDGMPKDRYRAYHAERARGGVAMVMTAGSASVSRDSPPAFGNVLAWQDAVVPWMARLAEACHEHGAAVMIQLTHLGRRTRWDRGDWLPVLGAGPAREPAHRAQPKLAEDWDVARVTGDFADACERMREAGLDGVELECYGHLLDQFWSPLTNALPAPWGGGVEERRAFALGVLRRCRERVGPGFLLGLRVVADEGEAGGIDPEEAVAFLRELKGEGLLDFLNVIRGRIHSDAALTEVIPLMGMPSAPHLGLAGRVRAEVGLPTLHAARIADLATARHAVASGAVDLVGMTRAHIAEPHLVRKLQEGREAEIRPCVGATYCLDRIYQGGEALCIHNPATGRELSMPHVIAPGPRRRRVVVVGAGPGGLEAARVAGERGHEVTVLEAAGAPGGQVRLAARSPRRREMMSLVDWRMAEAARAGVTFRFDAWAEAEDVLALGPDLVVVATGGLPDTAVVEGAEALAHSAWDVLSGDVRAAGGRWLVYDEAGDHAGLQAAEMLAEAGAEVEVMTPDRAVAPEVMGMNLTPYVRALQRRGARLTVTWRLLALRREGNALAGLLGTDYSDHREERSWDRVVVNAGTRPLDGIYHDLRERSWNRGAVDHAALAEGRAQPGGPAGGLTLWRIGDAVAGRNVHAAVFDALRLLKDA